MRFLICPFKVYNTSKYFQIRVFLVVNAFKIINISHNKFPLVA